MANPLARVVMNNIAQKSGMVEVKSSRARDVNTISSNNLGKRETQLLSGLLNNKKSVSSSSSSYNKSTYGRSSNVSNPSRSMQTLSSLVSGRVETEDRKASCEVNKSRQNLKSLCNLDNMSVGKSSVSKDNSRNVMKKLNLDELVQGTSKSEKREVKTSYKKQTGGMTTLGDLANEKSKNRQSDNIKSDNVTTNNSYVRSNVINNLEAYIPKVTLESIGKKGSLF